MYSTLYSGQIKKDLNFSPQIFGKYSNIKFNENPSSWSQAVLCIQVDRQTDRYDEPNSCFSQFYQRGRQGVPFCLPCLFLAVC